jgi:hypothetical protein
MSRIKELFGDIKPTNEQKSELRKSFETQIGLAAVLSGKLKPEEFIARMKKVLNPKKKSGICN